MTARLTHRTAFLLVAVTQIAYLWPMLHTGYLGDDNFNVDAPAALDLTGMSFMERTWGIAEDWITKAGRWFPLAFFQTYGEFQLLQDRLAYKLLLLGLVLFSTACFAAALRRLGASPGTTVLTGLGATLLLQFRPYADPVMAYAGVQELILAEVALSVLLFHFWLCKRHWWSLAGSLFLFAVACSTYESAPLLVVLHVIVAMAQRRHIAAGVRASLPAVGLAVAFLALSACLRALASAPSSPYDPNLQPGIVLETFGEQLLGTLPLSHLAFDPSHVFVNRSQVILGALRPSAILAGLVAGVVAWIAVRSVLDGPGADVSPALLAAFGAVLLVAPAAPVALAPKYQHELVAGIAYLPVFLQAFGLAALAAALLTNLGRRAPPPARRGAAAVIATGLAGLAVLSHQANAVVVDYLQPYTDARDHSAAALEAGALADVPARGQVTFKGGVGWMSPEFVYRHAGRRVALTATTLGLADLRAQGHTAGHLLLTTPTTTIVVPFDGRSGTTRVFLSDPDDDGLATLPPDADPDKLVIETGVPGVGLAFFDGCDVAESNPPHISHWCERRGALALFNTKSDARAVDLRFAVATAGPRPATVTARRASRPPRTLAVSNEPRPYAETVRLPAHGSVTIRLSTNGRRVKAPADPRRLYFKLTDVRLSERAG